MSTDRSRLNNAREIVSALKEEGAFRRQLADSMDDARKRHFAVVFERLAEPGGLRVRDWLLANGVRVKRGSEGEGKTPSEQACALARCVGMFQPQTVWEGLPKEDRDQVLDRMERFAGELADLLAGDRPPLPAFLWLPESFAPGGLISLETWRALESEGLEEVLRKVVRQVQIHRQTRVRNARPNTGKVPPSCRVLARHIAEWFKRNYATPEPTEVIADLVCLNSPEVCDDVTGEL